MLKENAMAVSIFCLAISIIVSAVIIGNGIKMNGDYIGTGLNNLSDKVTYIGNNQNPNTESTVFVRNTYNLTTAAAYLGISDSRMVDIINSKESGIPYVKIGSDYLFSKGALDKWLETVRVEIK